MGPGCHDPREGEPWRIALVPLCELTASTSGQIVAETICSAILAPPVAPSFESDLHSCAHFALVDPRRPGWGAGRWA